MAQKNGMYIKVQPQNFWYIVTRKFHSVDELEICSGNFEVLSELIWEVVSENGGSLAIFKKAISAVFDADLTRLIIYEKFGEIRAGKSLKGWGTSAYYNTDDALAAFDSLKIQINAKHRKLSMFIFFHLLIQLQLYKPTRTFKQHITYGELTIPPYEEIIAYSHHAYAMASIKKTIESTVFVKFDPTMPYNFKEVITQWSSVWDMSMMHPTNLNFHFTNAMYCIRMFLTHDKEMDPLIANSENLAKLSYIEPFTSYALKKNMSKPRQYQVTNQMLTGINLVWEIIQGMTTRFKLVDTHTLSSMIDVQKYYNPKSRFYDAVIVQLGIDDLKFHKDQYFTSKLNFMGRLGSSKSLNVHLSEDSLGMVSNIMDDFGPKFYDEASQRLLSVVLEYDQTDSFIQVENLDSVISDALKEKIFFCYALEHSMSYPVELKIENGEINIHFEFPYDTELIETTLTEYLNIHAPGIARSTDPWDVILFSDSASTKGEFKIGRQNAVAELKPTDLIEKDVFGQITPFSKELRTKGFKLYGLSDASTDIQEDSTVHVINMCQNYPFSAIIEMHTLSRNEIYTAILEERMRNFDVIKSSALGVIDASFSDDTRIKDIYNRAVHHLFYDRLTKLMKSPVIDSFKTKFFRDYKDGQFSHFPQRPLLNALNHKTVQMNFAVVFIRFVLDFEGVGQDVPEYIPNNYVKHIEACSLYFDNLLEFVHFNDDYMTEYINATTNIAEYAKDYKVYV